VSAVQSLALDLRKAAMKARWFLVGVLLIVPALPGSGRRLAGNALGNWANAQLVRQLVRGQESSSVNWADAESAFKLALVLSQQTHGANTGLAQIYISDGAPERAAVALERHLKIFPSDSSARWLVGVVYVSMGKTTCATQAWRQIGDERAVAGRLYALGMSAAQSGDRNAAETWYLVALEVDPTDVDVLYTLGGFYWGQDRNRAVEYLQRAVQVDREPSARRHMALGQIHYAASNWDAAIAAFEDALLLDPGRAQAHHFLGGALRQKGDLSGAIQALNKAIMLDGQDFWSYVLLGQIRLEQARYDLAIRELEEASMISPEDALVHALLGEAFRHAGELELAIAEFQLASTLDECNVSYHLQLGMLHEATADLSEAAGEYEAVLVLAPGNSYATQRLRQLREQ